MSLTYVLKLTFSRVGLIFKCNLNDLCSFSIEKNMQGLNMLLSKKKFLV